MKEKPSRSEMVTCDRCGDEIPKGEEIEVKEWPELGTGKVQVYEPPLNYCGGCFITVKNYSEVRYFESEEHLKRYVPQV